MLGEQVVGAERYLKRELIGNGGFARCYLMVSVRTGERFAGKVIRGRELRERGARAKVMQEVEIHRATDHPNVVRLLEVFEFEGEMYIILELCANNSMKELLRNRVRLTEFEARCYLRQLTHGLDYLHGRGIVHRDIKLGNIFLTSRMQVKIGDFGLSTRLENHRQRRFTTCGTPNYIAPEILAESGHGFEVDLWALGIILYALLVGKPPFESQTVEETYQRIKEGAFEFPKQVPLSTEAKSLIRGLLEPNPKNRLGLSQLRSQEWMSASGPELMPGYTISIPPQSSFLKQWSASEGASKLSIVPRRLSKEESSCVGQRGGREKLSRVLSCDKNTFRTIGDSSEQSQLNRAVLFNSRMKANLKEQLPLHTGLGRGRPGYESDGNEVICYYDLSAKYGVGYLLSNGSCGVAFNDQTSLTDCRGWLLYFDGKNANKVEVGSEFLKKKQAILGICLQKLGEYRQKNVLIAFESRVFVKRFVRGKDVLVLKLSNGVLQFFWGGDSVTVRGYRWVRWRIGRDEGEGPITGRVFPQSIEGRVQKVREFLQKEGERSQKRKN